MLANGARTFLHRYGVKVGEHGVVFTTNDSAYLGGVRPARRGRDDQRDRRCARTDVGQDLRDECTARGITMHPGSVVSGTRGEARVTHAIVDRPGDDAAPAVMPCDVLLVSGGWNPAVHLYSQARGKLRYDERHRRVRPRRATRRRSASPARPTACSTYRDACAAAGRRRHPRSPRSASPPNRNPLRAKPIRFAPQARGVVLWYVPDADAATRQFVDVQRDATVADLVRAVGAGMRSMEHIKRYTTIGTAHDQGKTSGVVASGITVRTARRADGGPRRHHVPAALHAGRVRRARRPQPGPHVRPGAGDRGARLARRSRRGVRGRRHVEASAVLPAAAAKTWTTAVLRECAAVRGGVGILDGSTLGKIDVQGPDAGEFLDLLYTNMMSTPQGRDDPLRRDVRRRRHGHRRRHRHALGRRPVPWRSPPPAAPRTSSTGWRSGCRPSGRTFGCG